MEYEIKGVPLPVVICYLKKGDVMLSDSEAYLQTDGEIQRRTYRTGSYGT